ncbi:MAG: transposase [Dysgonamonadaceae bacterium]|nr:transposase [Dysgonamonadaceae bacterium]
MLFDGVYYHFRLKGRTEFSSVFHPANLNFFCLNSLSENRGTLYFKSVDKWTEKQKQRAKLLFELYPDIKKGYSLTHSLRMIFSKNTIKDAARLSLARWYNQVAESGFKSFNTISATVYEHYDEILNLFINRSTNASTESFDAKIKAFRASLRGITDIKFFLFRLANIYA